MELIQPLENSCAEDCGQFTSNCMCYGEQSTGTFQYINQDTSTDISFGTNSTTIKWQISLGGQAEADQTGPEINSCITSGGVATITITDVNGDVTIFNADALLSDGTTTGNWAFSGNGPGSFSGKIREVLISCSTSASEAGKACEWVSCDKLTTKWFDGLVELTQTQIDELYECELNLPEDCPVNVTQLQNCAAETIAGQATTGDFILTVLKQDCNNVIIESSQYNITTGNTLLTEPVLTTDCDPEPDVAQTEECILDTKKETWTEITIVQGTSITTIYINQATLAIGTPNGDPSEWTNCTVVESPISVICKAACVGGVKVDILIGLNPLGEYQWFKNLATGAFITEPDFAAECPELTCETRTETVCADGDYPGIVDEDQIILVIQDCSDGTSTITGATLLNNPTISILPLPSNILFQNCTTAIETELVGCVTDEDGVSWNVILVNGTTVAYQNKSDNSFGSPNGVTVECSAEVTLVGALSDKHCIEVDGVEYQAFLFVNSDKSICAKPVGGTTIYQQGEYVLISCCGATTVETLFEPGFTVARPTDTPNTGWNNQKINNATPLVGDFELCYTVTNMVGNTPQMIGINTDPNTNASYTSIDSALYLRLLNGLFRIYLYQNGVYGGLLYSGDFTNQEICYKRVGSLLTFTLNGSPIGSSNIGTANVFLDDSHYFANGTWGSGTITYSDFNLVTRAEDAVVRSVSECVTPTATPIIDTAAVCFTDDTSGYAVLQTNTDGTITILAQYEEDLITPITTFKAIQSCC